MSKDDTVVTDDRRLVSFIYDVLRDGHIAPGDIERLVQEAQGTPVVFSNGHLAKYAQDIADRLK